ncbi:MAG: RNA methyltransferase [Oscillospiraceae bacterium]|jgi:TrmH family RNA methyltransferase|nr:RNA methyltransferase [Oscillospiraceae bacterium]
MLITSKDNKYIKLYRTLSSSKKARLEQSLFTLEGERIVRDNPDSIKYLFVTEKYCEKYPDAFIISSEIAKAIALTETPQGIFAICNKPLQGEIPDSGKFLVLCNLQDPGNLGTILRTAASFNISAVICANCCDIYNPKTIRAAMGAVFAVQIIQTDLDVIFEHFKGYNIISNAAVLNGENVLNTDFKGNQAIFIGNEGNGLTEDIIERCDRKVTINIGGMESLNAATAAAIFIWEMNKF